MFCCSCVLLVLLLLALMVLVLLMFLLCVTLPGVGRGQPEGGCQESTLSGHAVLSPTAVLLSLCSSVSVGVLGLYASMSVCERVRGLSAVWPLVSLGRMAVGISASCRLDSRRMAWPHFTR